MLAEPLRVPRVMSADRYTKLYQEHVCSCAIRAAREVLAALPVCGAVVDVAVEHRDPVTAAVHTRAALSAGFASEMMANLGTLEGSASEVLAHIPHRRPPSQPGAATGAGSS